MADVRVTPAARAHLLDIWEYTAEHWGQDKADAYLRDIQAVFHGLANNPKLGNSRPDIATGYRSIVSGRHVIFYTLSNDDKYVNIIGVLHVRMDVRTHLG